MTFNSLNNMQFESMLQFSLDIALAQVWSENVLNLLNQYTPQSGCITVIGNNDKFWESEVVLR